MTTRRVPLSNVPNATNSPFRGIAAAGTKRTRSYAGEQRELPHKLTPPAKKQMIEIDNLEGRRQGLLKRNGGERPASFQTKLEALRVSKPIHKLPERVQKTQSENLENVRQWQKHYRKVFPQYVFFFESIPDDVRAKASRQIYILGAREEKFFSKAVTHVVTSRAVPPENGLSTALEMRTPSTHLTVTTHESVLNPRTINPLLLERPGDMQSNGHQHKSRLALDMPCTKKLQAATQTNNGDILHKAREMGMKIWALEKLQRMMTAMFNTEAGEQPSRAQGRRHNNSISFDAIPARGADLSQLLQNEKLVGQGDREWNSVTQDLVHFRGYYIYIHDMDEKTRPVMVRDYPKPATKEEGQWPQFRLTGPGKCPFIEETIRAKRGEALANHKPKSHVTECEQALPRTRGAAAAMVAVKQRAIDGARGSHALGEIDQNYHREPSRVLRTSVTQRSKPLDPPKSTAPKRDANEGMPPLFGSAQANLRGMPRCVRGEPIASGVQPSQVTSAIRSQMISSTAAAPGVRIGASKEVHQLKRKVLERYGVPSTNSVPSSYVNDVRAAINNERGSAPRAAKGRNQETVADIDQSVCRTRAGFRSKAEKETKPGYCENCKEKFDDFDEHVAGRKHRKFALSANNWKELDALLDQLVRPTKLRLIA